MQAKGMTLIAVSMLLILQFGSAILEHAPAVPSGEAKQPLLIRQGPMAGPGVSFLSPQYSWFQVGAFGDSATHNSIGANITIRTVYDKVNNDAHSYWVGSLLANGAFVQVGYLNGLSTTNQPYCCAWFYEFFPPGNTNSPPVIGPEGSAGPIGSWHTYSMIWNSTGGVWSFYFDNHRLGSSPSAGESNYLGSNAASTGNNTPAGIAEVAQATTNTDVIGPAEFKNFQFETSPFAWQAVPGGKLHIGFGATSSQALPNPYSAVEIEGNTTRADFLAGSYIPKPGPTPNSNPCGNVDPTILWGPTNICTGTVHYVSFSLIDKDGNNITPTWISMTDATGLQIFYTSYKNQPVPDPISGQWNITKVMWHAVNVAVGFQFSPLSLTETVPTNVFSVQLQVVGLFYSLPVSGATVLAVLPDSTNETVKTDGSGQTVLTQLPPATYTLRITVPNGLPSNTNRVLGGQSSITAKVFTLLDLITIIVPVILIATAVVAVIARKERQRQAALPTIMPATGPVHCSACGQILTAGARFCTNCGTPVRTMVS